MKPYSTLLSHMGAWCTCPRCAKDPSYKMSKAYKAEKARGRGKIRALNNQLCKEVEE